MSSLLTSYFFHRTRDTERPLDITAETIITDLDIEDTGPEQSEGCSITFIQNDSHGPSFSHPPPEIIDNEEEFEVEAILSHRGNGKRRRYLVKWVGYESSENQWVDDEALTNSQELLSEYKKAKNLK